MNTTFGSLVRQYIAAHDLSFQDVADKLGYRSKTSVARILQDATGCEPRQDFYERFAACYALTPAQRSEMETLLRISQMDVRQQQLYLCCRQMFLRRHTQSAVRCTDALTAGDVELSSLLRQRCRQSDRVTVLVFGYCSLAALRQIHQTLSTLKLTFEIRHAIYEGSDAVALAALTSQIAPFLFEPAYRLHCIPLKEGAAALDSLFDLHILHADGTAEDMLLVQLSPEKLLYHLQDGAALHQTLCAMLDSLCAVPLKTGSAAPVTPMQQAQQLIAHQQRLWEMEKDQAIYSYSKDPDLSLIPPAIFKSAAEWHGVSDGVPEELYGELCAVQQKRYQNLHAKKTPSQFILSRDSLKNFIWSGRLHNHPFMLRAFTPHERFDILSDVLSRMESDPFFSIRLADETMPQLWNAISLLAVRPMTRASAHGRALRGSVALLPATQPENGCTMLPLHQPELAAAFIAYYQDELLSCHTLPQRASRDLMQNMLQYHAARFG